MIVDTFFMIAYFCVEVLVDLDTFLLIHSSVGLGREGGTSLSLGTDLFSGNEIWEIFKKKKPEKSKLDYLGFVYDGKNVVIRPKKIGEIPRKKFILSKV